MPIACAAAVPRAPTPPSRTSSGRPKTTFKPTRGPPGTSSAHIIPCQPTCLSNVLRPCLSRLTDRYFFRARSTEAEVGPITYQYASAQHPSASLVCTRHTFYSMGTLGGKKETLQAGRARYLQPRRLRRTPGAVPRCIVLTTQRAPPAWALQHGLRCSPSGGPAASRASALWSSSWPRESTLHVVLGEWGGSACIRATPPDTACPWLTRSTIF